jgi:hypothetical protein
VPGSGSLKAAHKLGQRDVNADRGSKTATVYPPPKRVYDTYGRVVLSAQAPASGAGIATRNPIPKARPGGIDLIAPLGTIDAGEAGIRVSGNVNLAALQISRCRAPARVSRPSRRRASASRYQPRMPRQ